MPSATPIPDDEVWEGATRVVVGPPKGADPTGEIRAVEVLTEVVQVNDTPCRAFRARFVLDATEARRVAAGEPLWLSIYGDRLPPFDLAMTDPSE